MSMSLNNDSNKIEQPSVFTRPLPHFIIENFLEETLIERLWAHAVANEQAFEPTQVGSRKEGHFDPEIRVSLVHRDFGKLQTELDALFRAVVPQAMSELSLSPFTLSACEIELVAHGDGAFYKRHIDTATNDPEAKTQRVLTGVFYFHAQPKGFSGGQLRLHAIAPPEAGGGFCDIEPKHNRLVLFPAWAPHEVLPIICPSGAFEQSRFAINCWYRRASSFNMK